MAPNTPPQPTSFANGRYQVQEFPGEGGKKKVYLAHGTLLDREVAFALIKTEGLDDTSRQRIHREAQAMGRLGAHPHIVTVFDLGEERDTGGLETHPYAAAMLQPLFCRCGCIAAPRTTSTLQGGMSGQEDVDRFIELVSGVTPARGMVEAVYRLLGLLSHTTGNLDQAESHFGDAQMFCRKAGYRSELAWACCEYADTLLQRNGVDDRTKANALLDESLAISSELGMRPLMERVLSRREILRA